MRKIWLGFSGVLWIGATLMGFVYPAADSSLGEVQRLFYLHFGTYYAAFLLYVLGTVAGLAYLLNRQPHWDDIEWASLEVGTWFLSITIVTGMFVARPVWGVYWTWDPRLTSVAVMWMTYLAYFYLRHGTVGPDLQRYAGAVYAIVAFATVILNRLVLQAETNLTSPVLDFTSLSLGFSRAVGLTIWANILAYSVLGLTAMLMLARLKAKTESLQQRKSQLLEKI